jgi:hypothetical protein
MRAPVKLNRTFWPRALTALLPSATDPRVLAGAGITESEFTDAVSTLRFGRTYKTTRESRFPRTIGYLASRRYAAPPVMLDVGASDGVTSLDVMNALRHARYYVTDAHVNVFSCARGNRRYFYAANGECILVTDSAWIVYPDVQHAVPPFGAIARRWFVRAPKLESGAERITLINPRLRAMGADTVRVEQYNVLDRWPGENADIVIAANILNRGYFSGVDLDRAIDNLVAALSSGGRLVLIDNRATAGGFDESEQATVFRSCDGALEIEHRIGTGSEVEDLVPRQVPALTAEGAA